MSHFKTVWTIVVILCIMGVLSSKVCGQTVGLQFGSHLVPEKILVEKPINNVPRPFMFVGLSYQHNNGVSTSLTYTFQLRIISLSSNVPLWNMNKRRYNTFALLNNRKL